MSYESNIQASDHFFCGEDKTLSYEVFAAGSTTIMENVSGFKIHWELRKTVRDSAIYLSKTSTSTGGGIIVTGTYNSARAVNTQRVVIAIADVDTENIPPGSYYCALKRMDTGLEAVLSHGTAELLGAAVW